MEYIYILNGTAKNLLTNYHILTFIISHRMFFFFKCDKMLYQIMNDIQQSHKKNEMNCKYEYYELFGGKLLWIIQTNKQQCVYVQTYIFGEHLIHTFVEFSQNVLLNVICYYIMCRYLLTSTKQQENIPPKRKGCLYLNIYWVSIKYYDYTKIKYK